jgi:hypothetical protein
MWDLDEINGACGDDDDDAAVREKEKWLRISKFLISLLHGKPLIVVKVVMEMGHEVLVCCCSVVGQEKEGVACCCYWVSSASERKWIELGSRVVLSNSKWGP